MRSMWDIKKDLQIRKEELEKIKTYAGGKLEKAPEGSLRTSLSKGLFRYYEVKESGDTKGKYINAKKSSVAKELAEKDYCIKLLKQIDKELAGIERAMKILDRSAFSCKAPSRGAGERKVRTGFAEEIYDSFNEGRRRLVVPFIISDELFARSWQQADYATGNYKPEEKIYLTKKGEFVRSKSEVMLADMYFELGIPYRYEAELQLKGGRRTYPDFTLLDVRNKKVIYHEHMGLLDEEEYRYHNLRKIDEYRRNDIFIGKNLIVTHEAEGSPLNLRDIEKSTRWIFGLD